MLLLLLLTTLEQFSQVDHGIKQLNFGTLKLKQKLLIYKDIKDQLLLFVLTTLEQF